MSEDEKQRGIFVYLDSENNLKHRLTGDISFVEMLGLSTYLQNLLAMAMTAAAPFGLEAERNKEEECLQESSSES